MGQEQYISIIDIPNVSFLRNGIFQQVSKTEEAWYPEELLANLAGIAHRSTWMEVI